MFQTGSSREKEEKTHFLFIADVFFVNLIILFLLIASLYSCFQLSLYQITASEVRSTESNRVRSQVSQSDVLNTVSAEITRVEYHKFNLKEFGPSLTFSCSSYCFVYSLFNLLWIWNWTNEVLAQNTNVSDLSRKGIRFESHGDNDNSEYDFKLSRRLHAMKPFARINIVWLSFPCA
jgi:hypothetical protein